MTRSVRGHRRVLRAAARRQAHCSRCATDKNMWWAGNQSITRTSSPRSMPISQARRRHDATRGPLWRRDPTFQIKTRSSPSLPGTRCSSGTLLIRPEASALARFRAELTIIDLPSFRADPKRHGVRSKTLSRRFRPQDRPDRRVYAGEMKKSVFTTLNYLPASGDADALLGECGPKGDTAIFFGLSGTGKTTLGRSQPHADQRHEHGWGNDGVFNRGRMLRRHQAVGRSRIADLAASNRFGAVPRMWCFDEDTSRPTSTMVRKPRTRVGLSARLHPERPRTGRAGQPKNVVMLAADASACRRRLQNSRPRRRCITSCSATPRRSRAPNASGKRAAAGISPVFGSPFLPLILPSTATCCVS